MVDQRDMPEAQSAIAEPTSPPAIEMPVLKHRAAKELGAKLCSKWASLVGGHAPAQDDLVWTDLVQFILYSAREQARDAQRDEASQ